MQAHCVIESPKKSARRTSCYMPAVLLVWSCLDLLPNMEISEGLSSLQRFTARRGQAEVGKYGESR